MVREAVAGFGPHMLVGRVWAGSMKVGLTRTFLQEHSRSWESLLLVGKGLGAVTVVRALNAVVEPVYQRVALLTIDPTVPRLWRGRGGPVQAHLLLTTQVDRATNYFAPAGYKKQSGALLRGRAYGGRRVMNIPLAGEDHDSIVERAEVMAELRTMARWVHSGAL